MPSVFNWQIRRELDYPYEHERPQKQFAMVMDLNKCIACQTCTVACKTTWTPGRGQEYMLWNNVETKPYGYYPLGWDVKLLELLEDGQKWVDESYKGPTLFDAAPDGEPLAKWLPEEYDWAFPNIGEDEISEPVELGTVMDSLPQMAWMFYLPRICNHCTYPACVAACPRKAIYKRPEDGVVLIDPERCEGYQECVAACPYKKSIFNAVARISQKCIGCYPKIENGYQPQCVTTCIGRIRLQGFISPPDRIRPDNPIDFLVHVKRVALPLYPQSGLEPNVYYIPPIHVPKPFLRQMFGPGVDRAIDTYQRMRQGDEPEIQALLHLFGATERITHSFRVVGDEAISFDEQGREIVRVPLVERYQERPHEDPQLEVVRQDVP
ncbi:MAG TPA: 4Fe-4S dicluster domain-containing protein [Rhodospirillales bacterium]|nr:4Fe-4S dicluster domain-containing protein [Rhodospirillales bacterium]